MSAKPTLVILGTGFGAFSLIKKIDTSLYDVIVVSPRNHFIFTPLLPSTTVGTIEFRSIIEPIRTIQQGIRYYQASCTEINTQSQSITCRSHDEDPVFSLRYDILVIAVGCNTNTFGIPGVEEHALFLKELSDARAIRQRIIDCLEQASLPDVDEVERKHLLHFVVVGGGPTGVEFAAEMHDFIAEDLRKPFSLLMNDVRITLLEASGHLLNTFDATLGAYTMKHFARQRIEVRTGAIVTKVESSQVILNDGSAIPYGILVWSTGNGPMPLVRSLPFAQQKNSRIIVDEYLAVNGYANIYAFGDCATPEKTNYPATAQVAQQEGRYVGQLLNRKGRHQSLKPFRYKNLGMLAYIGSNHALADLASIKGHGFSSWLFWRSAYLTRLVSVKNKLLVLFDWGKTFIFGRDISRF
jgi:NADH:ubiquinone reductase (non-electrogenic)